jgi:hypothetical protein
MFHNVAAIVALATDISQWHRATKLRLAGILRNNITRV